MISNHQPFESEGRTQLGNCSDSHLPKLLRNFFSQSPAEKSSMCRFVISFLDLVGVNFPALRRDMFPLFHLTTLEKRRLSHSATKIVMIYDSSRFHHISYHISSCFITIIAIKKRHPSEIWSPFSITVSPPATLAPWQARGQPKRLGLEGRRAAVPPCPLRTCTPRRGHRRGIHFKH